MNLGLIRILQKIFWVIGWLVMVFAFIRIFHQVYLFTNPELVGHVGSFRFLDSMKLVFSAIAQAFFAFLVSSVFDMLTHRGPKNLAQSEKYLLLTCLGFVGEGMLAISSWLSGWSFLFSGGISANLNTYLAVAGQVLNLFPLLTSFVYGASIYILFRTFSQMVTFESEVI